MPTDPHRRAVRPRTAEYAGRLAGQRGGRGGARRAVSGLSLAGTVPQQLGYMSALLTLCAVRLHRALSPLGPPRALQVALHALTRAPLERSDMSVNAITGTIPQTLGSLPSLQKL